ncbi:helix-turn-helix transcriptional regulator [Vescimonas sp.]|uniref:helix-turn-helix domain-containing protein n=1 Tax=Vescimonas sp. TaxID=2892404 RepID=UPI003078B5D0
MQVKDAVAGRIRGLCRERGIKVNELANISGVTPSTVYSLLDPKRRDVSVITVKKLCDGLGMTLGEFFSAAEFDALEQEIV